MPRSTSGIAVSMARLPATLPSSSFSAFCGLYLSASLYSSAYGSAGSCSFPAGTFGVPLRFCMFSSIYAILRRLQLHIRVHQ